MALREVFDQCNDSFIEAAAQRVDARYREGGSIELQVYLEVGISQHARLRAESLVQSIAQIAAAGPAPIKVAWPHRSYKPHGAGTDNLLILDGKIARDGVKDRVIEEIRCERLGISSSNRTARLSPARADRPGVTGTFSGSAVGWGATDTRAVPRRLQLESSSEYRRR